MAVLARQDGDHALRLGIRRNLVSFVVIGASGLLLNLLVARFFEPSVLGAFNFVLAIVILSGQIGALGIQYSILHHVPTLLAHSRQPAAALTSALVLCLCISLGVTAGVVAARAPLSELAGSEHLSIGILAVAPGLLLFPLNKILLAQLNARRSMRLYAIVNASRYLSCVVVLACLILFGLPGQYVPLCISASEGMVFVGLIGANRSDISRLRKRALKVWCLRHVRFGVRAIVGAMLQELNTRVDVLVLGLVADMRAVGVYSLASIFAEGLVQLLVVFRYNYDPILARLVFERKWTELGALVRSGKRVGYVVMGVAGLIAMASFPLVVDLLVTKPGYHESWGVFAVLAAGIMLSAGYIPFAGLLQQAGFPGLQSVLITLVILTNLGGNLLLIPVYGVLGAAIATAVSQVAFVVYLVVLVKRSLAFNL